MEQYSGAGTLKDRFIARDIYQCLIDPFIYAFHCVWSRH